MRIKTVLFLAALSACSNKNDPPVIVEPDAPPDSPVELNKVTVDIFGESPVFIRYRTDGGDWQEPVDNGKAFEIEVGKDYELVAVCGSQATGFDTGITMTTYEDSPSTYVPCFGFGGGEQPAFVTVSGTMKQPGIVVLDGQQTSDTPNWDFTIDASVGLHDLIALDDFRSVIRRDLDIQRATTLPVIDTQSEGAALVDKTFTLDTSNDESVDTSVLWFTANGAAFLPSVTGTTAKLPPDSQLAVGDDQYVYLYASGTGGYRGAYVRQTSTSPTDISLLPALSGVSLSSTSATWSGSLPGTDADFQIYGGNASIYVTATAGWLAARSSLAIDTSILDSEWKIAVPDYQAFEATDGTQIVFRSTGVEQIAQGKRLAKTRARASMPRWHRELAAKFRR